jgi:hypothetical protein
MTSHPLGHDVRAHQVGDRAGIAGAAAMVADAVFGIEAVDAAVS